MSYNANDLTNRLLNALDSNYNVLNMQAVNEIISLLEKINITKELLETTRLGKHVNELRRKTKDPGLARRAKLLVKRWRDLVIPSSVSPGHTGSNRSSAERQVRRLGGTPLTSPALSRHVVSPALASPVPPSRPAWGGYESDSNDVILVDDEPPTQTSNVAAVKRPLSPDKQKIDNLAKHDKKPKKRRGHGRASTGAEATAWGARNGSGGDRGGDARRNGCRAPPADPYAALVSRVPPAGAKKVKTTQELLEQIQSRGGRAAASPPRSPLSPDVMLIEPETISIKADSPLVNGVETARSPAPHQPLEDFRDLPECTCEDTPLATCPAAREVRVTPAHVHALHHSHVPGVNGTRAPAQPHPFAHRKPEHPVHEGLFASVVPLFRYTNYADDYCVKNMSRAPVCTHIPHTEFAPPPPELPPPPKLPSPRPYPVEEIKEEAPSEENDELYKREEDPGVKYPKIGPAMVNLPVFLEQNERLKAPILFPEEDDQTESVRNGAEEVAQPRMEVEDSFANVKQEHRTVGKTKEVDLDGRLIYGLCEQTLRSVRFNYGQASSAPVVTLPEDPLEVAAVVDESLQRADEETRRDSLGRPVRPSGFSEWHESARVGDLIVLPYVVID